MKRVAAYCRVSTNKELQKTSLKIQTEAFRKIIEEHDDWEFAGIYADEGITGTSIRSRKQFMQMIEDAKNGKIDYILSKSISRFARNTLDTLKYTRELKECGVGVYFEEQSLDTLSLASEIFLTIHAAFAQEESHSISENMKRGYQNRFSMLRPKWSSTYGYKNVDGEWLIVESEARVVREIFDSFCKGRSLTEIAKALNENNIPAPCGKHWYVYTIAAIIHNEKYMGDVEMQKTVTIDHLTHKKAVNKTLPRYYSQDHHRPIVSAESYHLAQRIMKMKNAHRGAVQYPFYGFVKCPRCGENMVAVQLRTRGLERAWFCPHHRKACIREKYLFGLFGEKRVTYFELASSIYSITFDLSGVYPDFSKVFITYSDGSTAEKHIEFKKPSEIPAEDVSIGEIVTINGRKIESDFKSRASAESIFNLWEYLDSLKVDLTDEIPIVTRSGSNEDKADSV